jgi:hypothetical protein
VDNILFSVHCQARRCDCGDIRTLVSNLSRPFYTRRILKAHALGTLRFDGCDLIWFVDYFLLSGGINQCSPTNGELLCDECKKPFDYGQRWIGRMVEGRPPPGVDRSVSRPLSNPPRTTRCLRFGRLVEAVQQYVNQPKEQSESSEELGKSAKCHGGSKSLLGRYSSGSQAHKGRQECSGLVPSRADLTRRVPEISSLFSVVYGDRKNKTFYRQPPLPVEARSRHHCPLSVESASATRRKS